jgi:UDP-glucuronate 4-epimerase
VGLDNLNHYYDISLKQDRLRNLKQHDNFQFYRQDLNDRKELEEIFAKHRPLAVIHLAAQAGVRHSLDHPFEYVDSNVEGFLSILEACRNHPVEHLLYASSSSIYGGMTEVPFREDMIVDKPVSLYAATKKADELMAYTYSHLYGIPATGLRFFTVYGPWGRPDMAYFKFARKIMVGEAIDVYNHGDMQRDFTYVDDITEAMERLLTSPPNGDKGVPHEIFNIGNSHPENLMDFIGVLEQELGREATMNLLPMQPGDVPVTFADVSKLEAAIGYLPTTSLEVGLRRFIEWFIPYETARKAKEE